MIQDFKDWLKKSDENTKKELNGLDENQIEDSFYKDLSFGTGGLRGVIDAGTNRMNFYTVKRASLGLADYILSQTKNGRCVIAYDSRKFSREFAFSVADVLSSKNIQSYVFNELTPTPVLSYAVRKLNATAGVVITASHNPKEYNGYKVYNDNGCQITDEIAKQISAYIKTHDYFEQIDPNPDKIQIIFDEILDDFIAEIKKYSLNSVSNSLKVVYTPLHGTGLKPVTRILKEIGVENIIIVNEQADPDCEFTTCPSPNPEEKQALAIAVEYAKKEQADIVLATDPDADRVGVAIRLSNGEYRLLNANETGVVMQDYLLNCKSKKTSQKGDFVVIKTIVTTEMAKAIANNYGAQIKDVLTGFKYIGEMVDRVDNFVFGMEESYGYLVGSHVRDKDAISASMLIVEAVSYYKNQNKSLVDRLNELYEKYGYYKTGLLTKTYKGKTGREQMQKVVAKLRNNPLKEILGEEVIASADYLDGIDGLPKSNVLKFVTKNVKLVVRPSGTEPKLKIYIESVGKTEEQTTDKLNQVTAFVEKSIW